jgi:hypothetical protein
VSGGRTRTSLSLTKAILLTSVLSTRIKQKLREAGYGREVDWLGKRVSYRSNDWEFSNLKAVKQPKDLTARS